MFMLCFFWLTVINQNNHFSNQITGFILNATSFSQKTAVTVRNSVCLTSFSAAFCRPSNSQAHQWMLSLNFLLFHLFISLFLPSLSSSPLFWLIIPPLQKKLALAFFSLFSQSSQKAAGKQWKATMKTEEGYSSINSCKESLKCIHCSQRKTYIILTLQKAFKVISWFITYQVPRPMFQTENIKSMNPQDLTSSGVIPLIS